MDRVLFALVAIGGLFVPASAWACSMPIEYKPATPVIQSQPQSPESPREDNTLVYAATGGGVALLTGAAVLALRRTGPMA